MVIQKRRKELGLTASQLEQKLNLKKSTVTKWEKGVSFPRGETLLKLEEILEVSASEILKSILEEKQKSLSTKQILFQI